MRSDIIIQHEDWQDAPLQVFMQRFWLQQGRKGDLPAGVAEGPVVPVHISEGRWMAECPWGCARAIVASAADPRFMCVNCWNEDAGGLWLPVAFPAEKLTIERTLLARPARDGFTAATRNWWPSETIEALQAENLLRGLEAAIGVD